MRKKTLILRTFLWDNRQNLKIGICHGRVGVVEAASSSLVTQTKTRVHNEPSFFFCFLAKSLEISRFHVYKVLTAIFIPAKNRRNSRHDHIRDHKVLKVHHLITNVFRHFLIKFWRLSILENRLFYVFLIFQSLQQCISFKQQRSKVSITVFSNDPLLAYCVSNIEIWSLIFPYCQKKGFSH